MIYTPKFSVQLICNRIKGTSALPVAPCICLVYSQHRKINFPSSFPERQGDLSIGPHPRRWAHCVPVPRLGGAQRGGEGAVAAFSSAAVLGTAPLCHPQGRGGVGWAGGRLWDHEADRPNQAAALAPQHQRSGGDRRQDPGSHSWPPVQRGEVFVWQCFCHT